MLSRVDRYRLRVIAELFKLADWISDNGDALADAAREFERRTAPSSSSSSSSSPSTSSSSSSSSSSAPLEAPPGFVTVAAVKPAAAPAPAPELVIHPSGLVTNGAGKELGQLPRKGDTWTARNVVGLPPLVLPEQTADLPPRVRIMFQGSLTEIPLAEFLREWQWSSSSSSPVVPGKKAKPAPRKIQTARKRQTPSKGSRK